MQKEVESIQQLETRKDSLSKGIGRINDVYLSDPMRIGKVEVGSSFENTLEIGRTKLAARKAITGLNNKLEQVNNELRVNDEAKTYLNDLNLKRNQLTEMSELVVEGNLPEGILQHHQQEFEELQKRPDQNPLLKKAIDRIRQEEAKAKEAETEKEKDKKPLIEILPDGKVRLPNGLEVGGKVGELLSIVSEGSEYDLKKTDWIVGKMYPGVEYKTGLKRVEVIIYVARRRKLIGSGVELVCISDAVSKMHGEKGGYYLKRTEKPDQATQSGFQFEDGEVVAGEEGKLLKKLFPFSNDHIVSSQELIKELSTDDVQIDQKDFNQRLQETRGTLLDKSFRLAELPNLKEPENVGYYVETYRPPVRITLLGDTVRYRDEENQDKQIRLSEAEYSLLWTLAKGEPKLDTDESDKTIAESLNKILTELTGVDGIVTPLGNEDFGYWHKIKDANISRRAIYLPLRSTRQNALKLIFQDNPDVTYEGIINTLGPTSGRRYTPHRLTEPQAWRAVRRAIYSLKYRNIENITTEGESNLYKQMQEYIGKHDLADEKGLIAHIADKLGIARRPSAFNEDVSDAIEIPDIDSDYVDGVEERIQEDERDSGVASLPRMTKEEGIEAPEFGNLSKADVTLIAERLALQRNSLEPFLGERRVRLIEQSALSELADLVEGQEIGLQRNYEEQYYAGPMSEEELATLSNQLMSDYIVRAFEKAKEMLKDPNFGETVDRIGDQNPNVWGLLVNLSEINGVIERSGHEEGISLLSQNPEVLKNVLENPENEDSAIEDNLEALNGDRTVAEDNLVDKDAPPPRATTVFEAQSGVVGAVVEIESTEPKPSALERRDPEIRAIINNYLDDAIESIGIGNDLTSVGVANKFPKLKRQGIENGIEQRWISPKNVNGTYRFNVVDVATLMYLSNQGSDLPPQRKKRVQEIVHEEYRKRLNNNKANP